MSTGSEEKSDRESPYLNVKERFQNKQSDLGKKSINIFSSFQTKKYRRRANDYFISELKKINHKFFTLADIVFISC